MKKQTFNEKKYLEYHGLICPYCDSKEISAGNCGFDDNSAWRNVICNDCQKVWTETFIVTGAKPL